ncbi:MAG: hypothetical protein U0324_29880 [Polyangiales bacterium]
MTLTSTPLSGVTTTSQSVVRGCGSENTAKGAGYDALIVAGTHATLLCANHDVRLEPQPPRSTRAPRR